MIWKSGSTNFFFVLIQEQDFLSDRRMYLKTGMLGIGMKYKQIDYRMTTMGSSTICHRKANRCYKFSQDAVLL